MMRVRTLRAFCYDNAEALSLLFGAMATMSAAAYYLVLCVESIHVIFKIAMVVGVWYVLRYLLQSTVQKIVQRNLYGTYGIWRLHKVLSVLFAVHVPQSALEMIAASCQSLGPYDFGTIVITGATSGIGGAMLHELLTHLRDQMVPANGKMIATRNRIVLVGRSEQRLLQTICDACAQHCVVPSKSARESQFGLFVGDRTVNDRNTRFELDFAVLDLEHATSADVRQFCTLHVASPAQHGTLLGVMHVAGVCYDNPQLFTQLNDAAIQGMIHTNVTSTSLLYRFLLPLMGTAFAENETTAFKRSGNGPAHSFWLNVGSASAANPVAGVTPYLAHYAATKSYGMTMNKSLAIEQQLHYHRTMATTSQGEYRLVKFLSLDPNFVVTPMTGWEQSGWLVPNASMYAHTALTTQWFGNDFMRAQHHTGYMPHRMLQYASDVLRIITLDTMRVDAEVQNLKFG